MKNDFHYEKAFKHVGGLTNAPVPLLGEPAITKQRFEIPFEFFLEKWKVHEKSEETKAKEAGILKKIEECHTRNLGMITPGTKLYTDDIRLEDPYEQARVFCKLLENFDIKRVSFQKQTDIEGIHDYLEKETAIICIWSHFDKLMSYMAELKEINKGKKVLYLFPIIPRRYYGDRGAYKYQKKVEDVNQPNNYFFMFGWELLFEKPGLTPLRTKDNSRSLNYYDTKHMSSSNKKRENAIGDGMYKREKNEESKEEASVEKEKEPESSKKKSVYSKTNSIKTFEDASKELDKHLKIEIPEVYRVSVGKKKKKEETTSNSKVQPVGEKQGQSKEEGNPERMEKEQEEEKRKETIEVVSNAASSGFGNTGVSE